MLTGFALGVVMSTPAQAGSTSWCAQVRELHQAGVPGAAIAATISGSGESVSSEELACIQSLDLDQQVVESARGQAETAVERAKRQELERIQSLGSARVATLQHEWLQVQADALPPTAWTVDVGLDRIADRVTVTAVSMTAEPVQGWLAAAKNPGLAVRCRRGDVDVYVITGQVAAPTSTADRRAEAVARVDDGEVARLRVLESNSGSSLFFPDGEEWMDRLKGSSRLVFEYLPFRAGVAQVEFSTAGFESIAPLIERACSVEPWLPDGEAPEMTGQEGDGSSR